MMVTKDVKMATDNLSCPVCYQLFKNPKYLPCHHSYCEQCLEKMQVQSKIVCPECRKEAIVPPGGVKNLDNNFFISRLVDEFILKRRVEGETEGKCDECHGEDPIVAFCPDCTTFFCHVCNEHHKRSIKSRDHCIVPLTELRSKKDVVVVPKPKAMMCTEHDIELLFYCETCDQLVCMYCTVKDHSGHNHDTVKKIIGKQRQELKKITAPIEKMISGLSVTHDNIEKMRKKIRQQGDEVNKKIDQHFDLVFQKLMEQKEQLKQQVHDTVSQKVIAVTTQLEEVEYTQAEVLSMKELNNAVEKSSDQEVLSVKKQVIIRMEQVNVRYKKVNCPPIQQATLQFLPTNPHLGLLCSTATPDPHNCEIFNQPLYFIKGKNSRVNIITKDDNGDRCSRGGSKVSTQLKGVNGTQEVTDNNDGSYTASFVPQQVGEMKLTISINGQHIKGSPYNVVVRDYKSSKKPNKVMDINGSMGQPWGVAFSKSGVWAVADWSKYLVYVFDGEDQMINKFDSKGSVANQFYHPEGVAFDSDDNLYVTNCGKHRVQKYTVDGKFLLHFGGIGSEDGNLKYPNGLIAYNGKVYVSDRDNHRISVFQTNGVFLHTIGSGQLGIPSDVTVNNSHLLVADCAHHCIYTFTLDGHYVRTFGTYGSGKGQLKSPLGVAVDLYGFTLVADTSNHRISIFDKDGNYINRFGSNGSAIGQFQCPYGIAISANGSIYVSDHINKRIQICS